jgi:integrase
VLNLLAQFNMAVRHINQSWWIDIRHEHRRYRKRSPDNSRAGAHAYEATLRHKLARGEDIDSPHEKQNQEQLFHAFAQVWFDSYVRANNKISEIEAKKSILRSHLLPFFGNISVAKIDAMKVEQYKSKTLREGFSSKSINNQLTVLSTCLKAAQEWLGLGTIPKIKLLKTPAPKNDFLTTEESDALLGNLSGMACEIVLTAIRTGLRIAELKALRWQDIDWVNKRLTVRHSWCRYTKGLSTTKSNRVRYVPLTDDVYLTLIGRKQDTGVVFYTNKTNLNFDYDTIRQLLREGCIRANVKPIVFHQLRHSFASQLVMKGAPLAAVQQLLGHSDIRTTMRYSHLAQSSLRDAVNLLESAKFKNFGQPVGNADLLPSISELTYEPTGVRKSLK